MYSLHLSQKEISTLQWLAQRGYFPQEILDKMECETEPETDEREYNYFFPEHAAWSLFDLREDDPDAYLACLDPRSVLYDKICELENKIV